MDTPADRAAIAAARAAAKAEAERRTPGLHWVREAEPSQGPPDDNRTGRLPRTADPASPGEPGRG